MVKVRRDLTGRKFSRLTVLYQIEDRIYPSGKRRARWHCMCECGNECDVDGNHLTNGSIQSCGCLHDEKASINGKKGKKYNTYDLTGDCGIGWTSNTNREFYFDLDDYDLIKDYCWHEYITQGYSSLRAWNAKNRKIILFHHLLGCKNYDHADRNALNNTRKNLRPATVDENARNQNKKANNSSGFIGVTWYKNYSLWVAYISINKHKKHLGYFNNKEDAIVARLKAELIYYGDFAPQRHLFVEYGITTEEN